MLLLLLLLLLRFTYCTYAYVYVYVKYICMLCSDAFAVATTVLVFWMSAPTKNQTVSDLLRHIHAYGRVILLPPQLPFLAFYLFVVGLFAAATTLLTLLVCWESPQTGANSWGFCYRHHFIQSADAVCDGCLLALQFCLPNFSGCRVFLL